MPAGTWTNSVRTHRTLLTFEDRDPLTLDEREDLVDVLVDLLADLATWRDAHHHDLGMGAGREHLPEERCSPSLS